MGVELLRSSVFDEGLMEGKKYGSSTEIMLLCSWKAPGIFFSFPSFPSFYSDTLQLFGLLPMKS